MKTVLILSAVLCAALSISAASVGQPEADEVNPANASSVAAERPALVRSCFDNWASIGSKCYLLVNSRYTREQAENYCYAHYKANLASVHDIWEYKSLQRLAATAGHSAAWIGGYYFENEWRWQDGSEFDYQNWGIKVSYSTNPCLQLDTRGSNGWCNQRCNLPAPFICQVTPGC